MTFDSYDLPTLPEFRSPAFRRATALWRPRIKAALPSPDLFAAWTMIPAAGPRTDAPWAHKLYLCLDSRSYWPGVDRLLRAWERRPYTWKFFAHTSGYQRPDKIVVYAPSRAALGPMVRELRSLSRGFGFTPLRHAARASEFGLEPRGRDGIWIGSDPTFLGRVSWRYYRAVCFAFASINADYLRGLPGGAERWLRRMNLSVEHEGPRGLSPAPSDVRYVRRWWRAIHPGDIGE